ncbi:SDR family NAD(P)-dependent oxidoreductase [Nocardia paucivorans]|uniref:SDR family NAD(P)-dependent oxidoreductase n=1 Tax=Nocardia paucivorans TaxID=114259 RepID=UPI00031177DD|nr:SDR family oxidoreductase [Nocardia paucivorans]
MNDNATVRTAPPGPTTARRREYPAAGPPTRPELRLTGKTAIVTGGTRGIGRGIVRALAAHGAHVTAVGSKPGAAATELARELDTATAGGRVCFANVGDPEEVAAVAETVPSTVDIVVNNAGVISNTPLLQMDPAEWHRVLDTNLTGMYLMVRALLPRLGPSASIINISSAVATVGMPNRAHYTASKAGVHGLTRSLCKELGPQGIRVNTVAPGIIETDQIVGLSETQKQRYANLAALGRLGRPDDVAGAVLFLAGELAQFVNGVCLNVDGGI